MAGGSCCILHELKSISLQIVIYPVALIIASFPLGRYHLYFAKVRKVAPGKVIVSIQS